MPKKEHILPQLNCPRFHFVVAKLTGEESQLPPSILKMSRGSAVVTIKLVTDNFSPV
jgi:hypothetical protein